MPRHKKEPEQDLLALLKSIDTQLKLMDKRMEVLELQQKLSENKPPLPAAEPVSTYVPESASAAAAPADADVQAKNTASQSKLAVAPAAAGGSRSLDPTQDPARDLTPFGMLRRLSIVA